MKNKARILFVFGGVSPEYPVSLSSAASVLEHIDRTRFEPITVGITPEGAFLHYAGETERIREDTWQNGSTTPAVLSCDRTRPGLYLLSKDGLEYCPIDAVFPILHGPNGEDGRLQGLIEMAGLPLCGCGTLAGALCMDKKRAHDLVHAHGLRVPQSFEIRPQTPVSFWHREADAIGYPLFVKPIRSGSSFGISRVTSPQELDEAVQKAFRYDDRVVLEEAIPGFEVGCAVMGHEKLTVGIPDEIEIANGFFDYTEKYNLIHAAIHVPARVEKDVLTRIQDTAKTIYRVLGASGFARVDLFLTPDGELVFNEVNTIPGFTAHSRFPMMMQAAGYSFSDVVNRLIEEALNESMR